jgi:uncharacterized DUF497 family protein
MAIFWDEPKRLTNLRDHGLDFADVDAEFDFSDASITPTYAGPDGRSRFKATGFLDNELVTLVFSRLGTEAISLVSLRPASLKERKAHDSR